MKKKGKKIKKPARWLGWHFLKESQKLQYGDDRIPVDGKPLSAKGDLELCMNGMHASKDILHCLKYAPGPVLCRVELRGKRLDGDDKSVARTRVVLWRIDATTVLRRFAYWCADQAVRVHTVAALRATGNETDAKHAKLLAELPEIVDEKTSAAASAATSAAARDTARDAVWAAERDTAWVAASAAASAAVSAAASAAVSAAARDTVWAAAWDAAWAAAWDAAWAAARDAERTKLYDLVAEARGCTVAEL